VGKISSAGGANVAAAEKIVAQYSKTQPPLPIPPLTRRPPSDRTVDWVWCTIPVCNAQTVQLAAKSLGWKSKLIPYDITAGPQAEVQALEQAVQTKPDFIGATCGLPYSAFAAVIAQARKEHIPIGCGEAFGLTPGVAICAICEPTLHKSGQLEADIAIADAKGPVHMAYSYDPTDSGEVESYQGAVQEIKELGGPNSTIAPIDQDPTATEAANSATIVSYLQGHPSVKYLGLGTSDYVLSLPQALKSTGLSSRVKLIVNAPNSTDLAYLRSGAYYAIVDTELRLGPYRVTDAFARASVGDAIPASLADPDGWHQIFFQKDAPAGSVVPQPANYQEIFAKAWKVGG
jgi:ABC-type sugar transport system substrate-binding protein